MVNIVAYRNSIFCDREDAAVVLNEDICIDKFQKTLEAIAAPAQQPAE